GSLLGFERNVLPSSVVRFDLRTRAVTPFRTLTPPDAAGVPRLTKVMVTPDGKTFVFHFRRRTDVLYLLDPGTNSPPRRPPPPPPGPRAGVPAHAWHRGGRHRTAAGRNLLLVAVRGPHRGVSAATDRHQRAAPDDEDTEQST